MLKGQAGRCGGAKSVREQIETLHGGYVKPRAGGGPKGARTAGGMALRTGSATAPA